MKLALPRRGFSAASSSWASSDSSISSLLAKLTLGTVAASFALRQYSSPGLSLAEATASPNPAAPSPSERVKQEVSSFGRDGSYGKKDDTSLSTSSNFGLPEYSLDEVEKHTTKENGIWMVYQNKVYDVTDFIESHPGGEQKIMMAAGGSVEPFWAIYRFALRPKQIVSFSVCSTCPVSLSGNTWFPT